MPIDISPTTGEEYYSGSWTNIQNVLRVLDIADGKLATVTMDLVNFYQEMVDREIDIIAGELYHVPLRALNQVQPDGTTKSVFPGQLRRLAIYWASGLLLLNEFQNLAQNVTDQGQAYVDDSRRETFSLIRPTARLWGQEFKSNVSRTLPPSMQPSDFPQSNF